MENNDGKIKVRWEHEKTMKARDNNRRRGEKCGQRERRKNRSDRGGLFLYNKFVYLWWNWGKNIELTKLKRQKFTWKTSNRKKITESREISLYKNDRLQKLTKLLHPSINIAPVTSPGSNLFGKERRLSPATKDGNELKTPEKRWKLNESRKLYDGTKLIKYDGTRLKSWVLFKENLPKVIHFVWWQKD